MCVCVFMYDVCKNVVLWCIWYHPFQSRGNSGWVRVFCGYGLLVMSAQGRHLVGCLRALIFPPLGTGVGV